MLVLIYKIELFFLWERNDDTGKEAKKSRTTGKYLRVFFQNSRSIYKNTLIFKFTKLQNQVTKSLFLFISWPYIG